MERVLIESLEMTQSPEVIGERLGWGCGVILLRSGTVDSQGGRYSIFGYDPFLVFRSWGSRCELQVGELVGEVRFGNPWEVLEGLMARYEILEEADWPFPLGGCFGVWGYGLKDFVEPGLARLAVRDTDLPDCHVGFYDALIIFDHWLRRVWLISTGLRMDGSRDMEWARARLAELRGVLAGEPVWVSHRLRGGGTGTGLGRDWAGRVESNVTKDQFIGCVQRVLSYIRSGDIYQVNISQRLEGASGLSGWDWFRGLLEWSPAPYAAFMDGGSFQLASSSPEMFLRLSGRQVRTRPIKGTRPRSSDPDRDARLSYELQTSAKEMAELVMITDLLRNDLGRVCEFGTVQVPELMRLERYAQVQHLVSTVEGRLRPAVSHVAALASCFPGGSITGAPKIRAMEIIDELEPLARGMYTGCLGYLGFNEESQLSIIIRTAVCVPGRVYFAVGAGIVADSDPEAEYEETWAKAKGFLAVIESRGGGARRRGHLPEIIVGRRGRARS